MAVHCVDDGQEGDRWPTKPASTSTGGVPGVAGSNVARNSGLSCSPAPRITHWTEDTHAIDPIPGTRPDVIAASAEPTRANSPTHTGNAWRRNVLPTVRANAPACPERTIPAERLAHRATCAIVRSGLRFACRDPARDGRRHRRRFCRSPMLPVSVGVWHPWLRAEATVGLVRADALCPYRTGRTRTELSKIPDPALTRAVAATPTR
jgi:hypothetical protein